MLISVGTELPGTFLAYDELDPSSEAVVDAAHYKYSEDRWMRIERHEQVPTQNEKWKTHGSRQETRIDDRLYRYLEKCFELIEGLRPRCNSPLEQVRIAKHRKQLTPGLEVPGNWAPYQAGLKAIEFKRSRSKFAKGWRWE